MNEHMLIYLMTFLVVFMPVLIYVLFSSDKSSSRNRLKSEKEEDELPMLFRFCAVPTAILNAVGISAPFRKIFPAQYRKLKKDLSYAGLKLNPEDVYGARIFLVVFLSALAAGCAWMVLEEDQKMGIPIVAFIAAFIAWFMPGVAVGNLVQERQTKILQALPFSIDLISSAMRGGLDFSAAIRFYIKLGIRGPLTAEYSTMLREMELGVARTAALQNMADRIQLKEFTSFATAIVMGTELGASLADTMEIQSEEMRKLRFSIAECKAQRAPSLMLLPMALFILPAVFIIILTPVFLKMKEAGVPLF